MSRDGPHTFWDHENRHKSVISMNSFRATPSGEKIRSGHAWIVSYHSRRRCCLRSENGDNSTARVEVRSNGRRDRSPSGNLDVRGFEDPNQNFVQLANSVLVLKDTQQIAPYMPTYAELRKGDWSDNRVHRRAGIRANLLTGENLAAELTRRNYPEERAAKSSAAIYCGSCGRFCHDHFLMPDDESNR